MYESDVSMSENDNPKRRRYNNNYPTSHTDDSRISDLKARSRMRKGRGFTPVESAQETYMRRGAAEINQVPEAKPLRRPHTRSNAEIHLETVPERSIEGWIVFVTGVHDEATEEDILAPFQAFGTVRNIALNLDRRTGFLKGYAIVEFEKFEDADRARVEMNGQEILGVQIAVHWCFVKRDAKRDSNRAH